MIKTTQNFQEQQKYYDLRWTPKIGDKVLKKSNKMEKLGRAVRGIQGGMLNSQAMLSGFRLGMDRSTLKS